MALLSHIFSTGNAFPTDRDESPSTYTPLNILSKWYEPIILKKAEIKTPSTESLSQKVNNLYQELETELRMELNDEVLAYIKHYTTGQKQNFEIAISLEEHYHDLILSEIKKRNLPRELGYLPIVISGMHNQAIAPDGGVGVWKLNYIVARKYGLEINQFTDERKDVQKSTEAALNYLSDLYKKYGSWNLAVTAFSFSPGIVQKAIIRSGNKFNYWDVRSYFNPEVRNLVPAFFAAIYTAQFYPEHDLNPPAIKFSTTKKEFKISGPIAFSLMAKELEVDEQVLHMLNPLFRGEIIFPEDVSGLGFFIPEKVETNNIELEILAKKTNEEIQPKIVKTVYSAPPVTIPPNSVKVIYVVQSGDFLGKIAEKHNVGVSTLKRWNGLRSDRINIGQKLTIYISKAQATTTKTVPSPTKTTNSQPVKITGKVGYYTIKDGDTLWQIAKDHPGNSIETLQRLNDIGDNIKPGQVIKYIME